MGTTASLIDPLNYSPPPTPPQHMSSGSGSLDCDDDTHTVPLYDSSEPKHRCKPRFRREAFSGSLFDPELLAKAEFLSRNEWDRQVFIRYVLGEYWRGRVCPDLRQELALAGKSCSRGYPLLALPVKGSKAFAEDSVNSHLNFTLEDLLKIFSVTQCRSMLLACVLFSFFLFRRDVDFDVVFDEHSPSLPSAMKTLSTTDETHLAHDTVYEENGEFFLDPENVLSLISMSSTVEDLDQLLVDASWINHYISAIEDIKLAVIVEDVSSRPRPLTSDKKRPVPSLLTVSAPTPCSRTGSVSNPALLSDVPYLLFENKANKCLTLSQRESLQGLRSQRKSIASKGHVCLSQLAENKDKSAAHFLASLYVNDYVLNDTEKCGKMAVEDASKADTVSADEDEETPRPNPRYVVTLLHRITGAPHEKNSLRLADFVLFSISAALSPR